MEIKEGTVNALVGPSGSGKSTIAKLIAGLWDVKGGSITLGDVDVRSMTQADYNQYIAYVSQDNYLFDTTVMENIRMGNQSATDEEVVEAAKNSGCHDFIMSLEMVIRPLWAVPVGISPAASVSASPLPGPC